MSNRTSCSEWHRAGAPAWKRREVGRGPLCHVLQRGGAEGVRPSCGAAALVPVQPCHPRIQRGAEERSGVRDRALGYCTQPVEQSVRRRNERQESVTGGGGERGRRQRGGGRDGARGSAPCGGAPPAAPHSPPPPPP